MVNSNGSQSQSCALNEVRFTQPTLRRSSVGAQHDQSGARSALCETGFDNNGTSTERIDTETADSSPLQLLNTTVEKQTSDVDKQCSCKNDDGLDDDGGCGDEGVCGCCCCSNRRCRRHNGSSSTLPLDRAASGGHTHRSDAKCIGTSYDDDAAPAVLRHPVNNGESAADVNAAAAAIEQRRSKTKVDSVATVVRPTLVNMGDASCCRDKKINSSSSENSKTNRGSSSNRCCCTTRLIKCGDCCCSLSADSVACGAGRIETTDGRCSLSTTNSADSFVTFQIGQGRHVTESARPAAGEVDDADVVATGVSSRVNCKDKESADTMKSPARCSVSDNLCSINNDLVCNIVDSSSKAEPFNKDDADLVNTMDKDVEQELCDFRAKDNVANTVCVNSGKASLKLRNRSDDKPSLRCSLPLNKIGDISKLNCTAENVSLLPDNTSITDINCSVVLESSVNVSVSSSSPPSSENTTPKTSNTRRLLCLYCDRSFVSSNLKQKHVDRIHSANQSRRSSSRTPGHSQLIPVCMYCGKLDHIGNDLKKLLEHLVTEHSTKYHGCLSCEERFGSKESLKTHNVQQHGITYDEKNVAAVVEDEVVVDSICENDKSVASIVATQSPETAETSPQNTETRTIAKVAKPKRRRSPQKKVVQDSPASKITTSTPTASTQEKSEDDASSTGFVIDFEETITVNVISAEELRQKIEKQKEEEEKLEQELKSCKRTKQVTRKSKCSPRTRNQPDANNKTNNKRTTRSNNSSKTRQKPIKVPSDTATNETENRTVSSTVTEMAVKQETGAIVANSNENVNVNYEFDENFFSCVSFNIRENLLNHLDGKLNRKGESYTDLYATRVSQLETKWGQDISDNFGSNLALTALTPVSTLLSSQIGIDSYSQIEYGSKAPKETPKRNFVKYNFRNRKNKNNDVPQKDFSKLDMWTQIAMKTRQQKARQAFSTSSNKSQHENELKVEELNRILDTRGPFQDLHEEALNSSKVYEGNFGKESNTEVKNVIEDILVNVFSKSSPNEITNYRSSSDVNLDKYFDDRLENVANESKQLTFGLENKTQTQACADLMIITETLKMKRGQEFTRSSTNACSKKNASQLNHDIPTYFNLTRNFTVQQKNDGGDVESLIKFGLSSNRLVQFLADLDCENVVSSSVELSGEWARPKIYICAACGVKVSNLKLLEEHKNVSHPYVWCTHYEFVGSQSQFYRHLNIPGLGSVHEEKKKDDGVGGATATVVAASSCDETGGKTWARSDARTCTKCAKQCNSLADLHRHMLDCGGDWTWMYAKKKCKYRPYGARSRRRRQRGMKRNNGESDSSEKRREQRNRNRSNRLRREGPRPPRPSDAESIQRMLANLPAKRATRKIICLKDGFQRPRKQHATTAASAAANPKSAVANKYNKGTTVVRGRHHRSAATSTSSSTSSTSTTNAMQQRKNDIKFKSARLRQLYCKNENQKIKKALQRNLRDRNKLLTNKEKQKQTTVETKETVEGTDDSDIPLAGVLSSVLESDSVKRTKSKTVVKYLEEERQDDKLPANVGSAKKVIKSKNKANAKVISSKIIDTALGPKTKMLDAVSKTLSTNKFKQTRKMTLKKSNEVLNHNFVNSNSILKTRKSSRINPDLVVSDGNLDVNVSVKRVTFKNPPAKLKQTKSLFSRTKSFKKSLNILTRNLRSSNRNKDDDIADGRDSAKATKTKVISKNGRGSQNVDIQTAGDGGADVTDGKSVQLIVEGNKDTTEDNKQSNRVFKKIQKKVSMLKSKLKENKSSTSRSFGLQKSIKLVKQLDLRRSKRNVIENKMSPQSAAKVDECISSVIAQSNKSLVKNKKIIKSKSKMSGLKKVLEKIKATANKTDTNFTVLDELSDKKSATADIEEKKEEQVVSLRAPTDDFIQMPTLEKVTPLGDSPSTKDISKDIPVLSPIPLIVSNRSSTTDNPPEKSLTCRQLSFELKIPQISPRRFLPPSSAVNFKCAPNPEIGGPVNENPFLPIQINTNMTSDGSSSLYNDNFTEQTQVLDLSKSSNSPDKFRSSASVKKPVRRLNDCIAMLTNKLQEKMMGGIDNREGSIQPINDNTLITDQGILIPSIERSLINRPLIDRPSIDKSSIDRPSIDKPSIDRPLIDKPLIERPSIDRPSLDRPPLDRPSIDDNSAFRTKEDNKILNPKERVTLVVPVVNNPSVCTVGENLARAAQFPNPNLLQFSFQQSFENSILQSESLLADKQKKENKTKQAKLKGCTNEPKDSDIKDTLINHLLNKKVNEIFDGELDTAFIGNDIETFGKIFTKKKKRHSSKKCRNKKEYKSPCETPVKNVENTIEIKENDALTGGASVIKDVTTQTDLVDDFSQTDNRAPSEEVVNQIDVSSTVSVFESAAAPIIESSLVTDPIEDSNLPSILDSIPININKVKSKKKKSSISNYLIPKRIEITEENCVKLNLSNIDVAESAEISVKNVEGTKQSKVEELLPSREDTAPLSEDKFSKIKLKQISDVEASLKNTDTGNKTCTEVETIDSVEKNSGQTNDDDKQTESLQKCNETNGSVDNEVVVCDVKEIKKSISEDVKRGDDVTDLEVKRLDDKCSTGEHVKSNQDINLEAHQTNEELNKTEQKTIEVSENRELETDVNLIVPEVTENEEVNTVNSCENDKIIEIVEGDLKKQDEDEKDIDSNANDVISKDGCQIVTEIENSEATPPVLEQSNEVSSSPCTENVIEKLLEIIDDSKKRDRSENSEFDLKEKEIPSDTEKRGDNEETLEESVVQDIEKNRDIDELNNASDASDISEDLPLSLLKNKFLKTKKILKKSRFNKRTTKKSRSRKSKKGCFPKISLKKFRTAVNSESKFENANSEDTMDVAKAIISFEKANELENSKNIEERNLQDSLSVNNASEKILFEQNLLSENIISVNLNASKDSNTSLCNTKVHDIGKENTKQSKPFRRLPKRNSKKPKIKILPDEPLSKIVDAADDKNKDKDDLIESNNVIAEQIDLSIDLNEKIDCSNSFEDVTEVPAEVPVLEKTDSDSKTNDALVVEQNSCANLPAEKETSKEDNKNASSDSEDDVPLAKFIQQKNGDETLPSVNSLSDVPEMKSDKNSETIDQKVPEIHKPKNKNRKFVKKRWKRKRKPKYISKLQENNKIQDKDDVPVGNGSQNEGRGVQEEKTFENVTDNSKNEQELVTEPLLEETVASASKSKENDTPVEEICGERNTDVAVTDEISERELEALKEQQNMAERELMEENEKTTNVSEQECPNNELPAINTDTDNSEHDSTYNSSENGSTYPFDYSNESQFRVDDTDTKPEHAPLILRIKTFPKSTKISKKAQKSKTHYCDICDKHFCRADNLVKHKMTFTHIAKLSELEAKQAETRRLNDESDFTSAAMDFVDELPKNEYKNEEDAEEKADQSPPVYSRLTLQSSLRIRIPADINAICVKELIESQTSRKKTNDCETIESQTSREKTNDCELTSREKTDDCELTSHEKTNDCETIESQTSRKKTNDCELTSHEKTNDCETIESQTSREKTNDCELMESRKTNDCENTDSTMLDVSLDKELTDSADLSTNDNSVLSNNDTNIEPCLGSGINYPDLVTSNQPRRYKSLGERKSFDASSAPRTPTPTAFLDSAEIEQNSYQNVTPVPPLENSNSNNFNDLMSNDDGSNRTENVPLRKDDNRLNDDTEKTDERLNNQNKDNEVLTSFSEIISHTENTSNQNATFEQCTTVTDSVPVGQFRTEHFEEQYTRKKLNRDEELFLECCSLLKSSSEARKLKKHMAFDLKPNEEPEALKDGGRVQTPITECDSNTGQYDWSESNSIVSEWMPSRNENSNTWTDETSKQVNDSEPVVQYEDVSLASIEEVAAETSSRNCDQGEENGVSDISGEKINKRQTNFKTCLSKALGDLLEETAGSKTQEKTDKTEREVPATPVSENSSDKETETQSADNKKMLTKGAMKIFESIKVSIPTNEINLNEVLSNVKSNVKAAVDTSNEQTKTSESSLKLYKNGVDVTKNCLKSFKNKLTKSSSTKTKKSEDRYSFVSKFRRNSPKKKQGILGRFGNSLGLKEVKRKASTKKGLSKNKNAQQNSENKIKDVYDFEDSQDNSELDLTKFPLFKSFRDQMTKTNTSDDPVVEQKSDEGETVRDGESFQIANDNASEGSDSEPHPYIDSLSVDEDTASSEHTLLQPSKTVKRKRSFRFTKRKSIKKDNQKKCVIMGRIFKHAVKSKQSEAEIAKSKSEYAVSHKLTKKEIDSIFDALLESEKKNKLEKNEPTEPPPKTDAPTEPIAVENLQNQFVLPERPKSKPTKKRKKRLLKSDGDNSDDLTSDDEFSLVKRKTPKNSKKRVKQKRPNKRPKHIDESINIEQEIRECIGVAGRKSQRKCTSGKQNVLVEFWSSDEFTDVEVTTKTKSKPKPASSEQPVLTDKNEPQQQVEKDVSVKVDENNLQNVEKTTDLDKINEPVSLAPEINSQIDESASSENKVCKTKKHLVNKTISNREKTKPVKNKSATKKLKVHANVDVVNANESGENMCRIEGSDADGDVNSQGENVKGIAATRRKRNAGETLYYWSSSSDDELVDMIEVKPARDEPDDDRPVQHGWIVGDSPKKLVTLLAHAKGKKVDAECVKEQNIKKK